MKKRILNQLLYGAITLFNLLNGTSGSFEINLKINTTMGFAICHIEKGKGSSTQIQHHIDRTPGKEYSFPHADPALRHLNRELISLLPVEDLIKDRIAKGYTGKKAIRKDAVKFLKLVLTGSHEEMKMMEKEGGLKHWVDENEKWLNQKFGTGNLVRLTLHLDERTPHLHAIVVPIKDGKLSAKLFIGSPEMLRNLQTEYGEAMSRFGLERGLKGSKAIHTDMKEYHAIVGKAMVEMKDLYLPPHSNEEEIR